MGDILVVKKKGNKLKIKVAMRKRNQYSDPEYSKSLNPKDPTDLALFFADLKIYCNSPIEKAMKIMKKEEEEIGKDFLFWSGKK